MTIRRTQNLQLTMDDKTESYSVDRVNANTQKIDDRFGEIETDLSRLRNLELNDSKIDITDEGKKLDAVIRELKEADRNNAENLRALKIDDEHVDVISKRKKLNLVLRDLESSVRELKTESDRNHEDFQALNRIVDNSTERDRVANDRHYEVKARIENLIGEPILEWGLPLVGGDED